MRGYLSIDFTVSVVLLMTFISVIVYHYSLNFEVLKKMSNLSSQSIEIITNKTIKLINLSIINLSYKSYDSFIQKKILVNWFEICRQGRYTITCEFSGTAMNCYINNTNIEIKPICHERPQICRRWCRDQYFGRGSQPPSAGDRIYNIVYVK